MLFWEFLEVYNQAGETFVITGREGRNCQYNQQPEKNQKNVFTSLFVVKVFFVYPYLFFIYLLSGTGIYCDGTEQIEYRIEGCPTSATSSKS